MKICSISSNLYPHRVFEMTTAANRISLLLLASKRLAMSSSLIQPSQPLRRSLNDTTARSFSSSQCIFQSDEFSIDSLSETVETKNLATAKAGTSPAVGGTVDISNLDRLEKSLNKVQLLGRVGSDPQLRGTEKNPVLLFSLATHENFRDETGALKQKTMWHRVAVFKSGLRETAFKYLRKGQRVYVSGQISYGMVKDPTVNVIRTTTSIIGEDVIVMSGPIGSNEP